MKVVGTIVEYNPLHNGHIHAITEIRKKSQADILIAVLSGNFTMRGDLSLFDKFEKTKQALKASIDLVIELPFVLCVQNGDRFARNAVQQLYLAGAQELWFGSEMNDPTLYSTCYEQWKTLEAQEKIKEQLSCGKSYKEATASIINLPSNDLLGFCYYKAIQELNYPMTLHTIQRIGSYNAVKAQEYASAYAIRQDLSLIKDYCPNFIHPSKIRDSRVLFLYLKYSILACSTSELKDIFLVEEGIENKLKKLQDFQTYEDFVELLSTKRYTKSRIQRMLSYILFHITKQEIQSIMNYSYLRILGYSNVGKAYLNSLKKKTEILTNIKEGIHPALDIELKITKLLDMIYSTSTLYLEQKGPQEI